MNFREQVHADIGNVFLNSAEFAEIMDVRYDGVHYREIPVVLTKIRQTESQLLAMEHTRLERDNLNGVHVAGAKAHIAEKDLGIIPEQGQWIFFADGTAAGETFWQKYKIVTSDAEMGMILLELEAYTE